MQPLALRMGPLLSEAKLQSIMNFLVRWRSLAGQLASAPQVWKGSEGDSRSSAGGLHGLLDTATFAGAHAGGGLGRLEPAS